MTAPSRIAPVAAPLASRVKWALQQLREPIGVYALADMLTRATGKKHFANSIYRALHRLRNDGDALNLISTNTWVLRRCAAPGPMLVLLCTMCSRTTQRSAGELTARLDAVTRDHHFRPAYAHLEMLGWCRACCKGTAPGPAQGKRQAPSCG